MSQIQRGTMKTKLIGGLSAAVALAGMAIPVVAHADDAQPEATTDWTAPSIPQIKDSFKISDGTITATLHPHFPQVIAYSLGDRTILGHSGDAISSVLVNGKEQKVTVEAPQVTNDSATYRIAIPSLKAHLTATISLSKGTLHWEISAIDDPEGRIDRLQIPRLNLVTVSAANKGELRFGTNKSNRAIGDTVIDFSNKDTTAANGWFAAASDSALAAGLYSNAIGDEEVPDKEWKQKPDSKDVNHRWLGAVHTAPDGTATASISPGEWVIFGREARGANKIGQEPLPFADVRLVGDINNSGAVDWQDSAIATRELMVAKGLPRGFTETKKQVVQRIPFNIVSQATHPFLRTLDDTKRISLATDNLGQLVLLKGYQAEGHDSAHGDYGSHYNDRAGGFKDLVTLLKDSRDFNAKYGVHVNVTETYSEAQCMDDGEHGTKGTGANYENSCTINPHNPQWGWMNQSYAMNSVEDLTTGKVLNRFQNFRDELSGKKAVDGFTADDVSDQLDWLYFDVYRRYGWMGKRLSDEMNKQGWQVGSEWAHSMADNSRWSHWATEERYGLSHGYGSLKGINSMLVRFIENSWRDTWNPDSLLMNTNLEEFEGWQGKYDYNPFIANIWQRNLPVKFLQQSDLLTYAQPKDGKEGSATFTNGTVVTTKVPTTNEFVWKTDEKGNKYREADSKKNNPIYDQRTITYAGQTVYNNGAYLLPWNATDGVGTETDSGSKLYHYNPAGGTSTWKLTGTFAATPSFTLYRLGDDGRTEPHTVPNVGGTVTLTTEPHTPYVLYPNAAPRKTDPNWGAGSFISDPGFFSGDLTKHYTVTGQAGIVTTDRGNRQAELRGPGAASISQTLTKLPQGDYSVWAWIEIEPGKKRPVALSVTGKGVTAAGSQPVANGVPTTRLTMSTAQNGTASDEKLKTYFQRARVTFHSDGEPVTFTIAAGAGDAKVSIDDLRIVSFTAPKDAASTPGTVIFEDFEHVDSSYWPFTTGSDQAQYGDARTQMAVKHSPYSDSGWYGRDLKGTIVKKGKLSDNVLSGNWSVLAHEENEGVFLRTTEASVPFAHGHKYRVSMDYQNSYAGMHNLILGFDTVKDGQPVSEKVQTIPVEEARGTGVGGPGTQKLILEFTADKDGVYWVGFEKIAEAWGVDLTIDNFRVEDLGVAAKDSDGAGEAGKGPGGSDGGTSGGSSQAGNHNHAGKVKASELSKTGVSLGFAIALTGTLVCGGILLRRRKFS